MRELLEATVHCHHRLVRVDAIAVVQSVHHELGPVFETHLEHRNRLIDSAEKPCLLTRELHGHERRPTVGDEDIARPECRGVGESSAPELIDRELERRRVETLTATRRHWLATEESATRTKEPPASCLRGAVFRRRAGDHRWVDAGHLPWVERAVERLARHESAIANDVVDTASRG